MKKTVLFLLFNLLTLIITSQTFLKSTSVTVGILNEETNEFVFKAPFEINDVLIKFDDIDVIVYSQEPQEYYIYSGEYEFNEGNGTYWLAFDKNGVKCRIYIYKNDLNEAFFGVEYSDVCWIYFLTIIK